MTAPLLIAEVTVLLYVVRSSRTFGVHIGTSNFLILIILPPFDILDCRRDLPSLAKTFLPAADIAR